MNHAMNPFSWLMVLLNLYDYYIPFVEFQISQYLYIFLHEIVVNFCIKKFHCWRLNIRYLWINWLAIHQIDHRSHIIVIFANHKHKMQWKKKSKSAECQSVNTSIGCCFFFSSSLVVVFVRSHLDLFLFVADAAQCNGWEHPHCGAIHKNKQHQRTARRSRRRHLGRKEQQQKH